MTVDNDSVFPQDWRDPQWENPRKAHEWKNHVSFEVRRLWKTFTAEQQRALAYQAWNAADREEWD